MRRLGGGQVARPGVRRCGNHPDEGHPLVYGFLPGPEGAPTFLVYGHYDVQPVDPLALWETPPFEPTVRDNKLFCRGAVDDKGQLLMHFRAVETYVAERGPLPVSLKFIIEGRRSRVGEHRALPRGRGQRGQSRMRRGPRFDTAMFAPKRPSITCGLRGLAYFQLTIETANTDLHSGGFGGAVPNPANVLADIISSMKDPALRTHPGGGRLTTTCFPFPTRKRGCTPSFRRSGKRRFSGRSASPRCSARRDSAPSNASGAVRPST
ncbi:MAG: M20/M25/M40 family metallo-hydrolase [Deltaproteobacteria bacterium]|nr:M20/M25/M40 family metallo-hydrolase [Deltaproteobacteria bacterium]